MPSAPAARACSIADSPWAWAVTGSPAACASSTSTRSSSRENWQLSTSVPGVVLPPLAITLTTSARRSARSRTAARIWVVPATSPPMCQQCPPTLVIGGPDATIVGRPGEALSRCSRTAQRRSPRSRTVVTPPASCRCNPPSITAASSSSPNRGSRSNAFGPPSPHKCTCMSIRPGRTVAWGKSATGQPCGTGPAMVSTPVILPSSTKTAAPPSHGRSPSNP
jgi:hypothetical protein